jgi:hypothetical protein
MLTGSAIYAQEAAQSGWAHLAQGGSARLVGLGWDALAHPGDVGFSAFNPALLQREHRGELSLTSQASLGGYGSASLSYGLPLGRRKDEPLKPLLVRDAQRGWRVASAPQWSFAIGLDYGSTGVLDERDEAGEWIGTFTAGHVSPRFASAAHWKSFTAGIGGKWSMMNFGPYTAQALALDAGVLWTVDSGRTSVGLVLRNAGRSIEYFAASPDALPLDVQFVLSQKLRHAPFRWNLTYSHLETWDLRYTDPQLITKDPLSGEVTVRQISIWNNALRHVHPSVEAQLGGRIFIQVGYDVRRQMEMRLPSRRSNPGLSFGLSLQTRKMSFQYGSAVYHVAGRLNQFTVLRRF